MKITHCKSLSNLNGDILIPIHKGMKPLNEYSQTTELIGNNQDLFLEDVLKSSGSVRTFYKDNHRIIFLDLGKRVDFGSMYKSFRSFSQKQKAILKNLAGIVFLDESIAHETLLEAAINGLLTGTYDIGLYKSEKSDSFNFDDTSLAIYTDQLSEQSISEISLKATYIAETQKRVMDLVNITGNKKSPESFEEWAKQSASSYGYESEIYDLERIKKEGMFAIEAVNRGSEFPAKFIILRYKPKKSGSYPKIGLVGKGITYDTGGLSIKASEGMMYMKCDMAGSAAVFGAVEAAAKLQIPVEITATIPVTDNLVDTLSIKPGDVIGSYSGKTIEVLNTDAEGRLILADALSWITKNTDVEHVIDLATLTGAAVRSLGYHAAALMGNDEKLVTSLLEAGQSTGEKLWEFPLWEEYFDDLQSDVADLKNIGTKPLAGQITAAKFLEQFIGDHASWAHIDIAGTSFGDTEFGKSKSATAFGVRLLISYMESLSK